MTDFLTTHATTAARQAGRRRRPAGRTVLRWTYAELESSEPVGQRLPRPRHGAWRQDRLVRPRLAAGRRVRQRSAQDRRDRSAAELPAHGPRGRVHHRPLRRTDSCSSTPNTCRCSARSAASAAQGRPTSSSSTVRCPGMVSADELTKRHPRQLPPAALAACLGGTMIYTSGTTGLPKGASRAVGSDPAPVAGTDRHDRLLGERRVPDDRPPVPLRPGRIHGLRARRWVRPSSSSASSTPRTGCDWSIVRRDVDVLAPTPIRLVCRLDGTIRGDVRHEFDEALLANLRRCRGATP